MPRRRGAAPLREISVCKGNKRKGNDAPASGVKKVQNPHNSGKAWKFRTKGGIRGIRRNFGNEAPRPESGFSHGRENTLKKEEIHMRNLKRALSLALASVMLLGMMVVGASAAEGYTDVDKDTHNIEAIDVLQVVNVMNGYAEDGDFHPEDLVTRAQMARIMAELLNLDYDYYEAVPSKFTDVTGGSAWAKKYVDACAANGIVSGRGNGIYDPTASVTAVEAASMMMRALGYFQNVDGDYEGGFESATVKQASQISLFSKIYGNAHDALNRNQVAQLALNTLESNMVYFDGDMGWEVNGVKMGYRSHYSFRTGTEAKYSAIDGLGDAIKLDGTTSLAQGQYYVNLGEQLYDGKLKLDKSTLDDFGRPSRHWEYDGKVIGTYIKKDLMKAEYTTEVTGRMLYDLLGKGIVEGKSTVEGKEYDYTFVIEIDGETVKEVLNDDNVIAGMTDKEYYFFDRNSLNHTNTNKVGGTGNGVLTQVFVDGGTKTVYIAIINTYLAKADSDYNTRKGEASFDVYDLKKLSGTNAGRLVKKDKETAKLAVPGEDFEAVKDVKADDICLVRVADGEVKDVIDPKVIDNATVTSFKLNSYVVADERYDYASTAEYDKEALALYDNDNMKNTTYRIYLDPYGYLIGIKKIDSELSYAFLTGINSYDENLRDATAIGNLVFLDGTSKNVTINMRDSENAQGDRFGGEKAKTWVSGTNGGNPYALYADTKVSSLMNTWVSFSVDDDDVYTLKEIANTPGTYDSKKPGQFHQGGLYYTNNDHTAKVYINNKSTSTDGAFSSGTKYSDIKSSISTLTKYNENFVKINKGSVALDGIPTTKWSKVYGNNNTVYLSAETEMILAKKTITSDAGTTPAVIITGASSVSKGVQSVDLAAYAAPAVIASDKDFAVDKMYLTDVSHGVYTLYDKNGYVIAAMVVGGDDGSNTSFAWVSSHGLSSESLVNGKWEYTRTVIINGEEVELKEVESNGMTKPDILQGTRDDDEHEYYDDLGYWWVVRTKADGSVKSITPIVDNDTDSAYKDYIYDIHDDSRDGTVILNQSFGILKSEKAAKPTGLTNDQKDFFPSGYKDGYVPKDTTTIDSESLSTYEVKAIGSTLQVEGKSHKWRGFAVAPGAKIAVVKDERVVRGTGDDRKVDWKYKEDKQFFTNDNDGNGLKQAVNYLTDTKAFRGYIAAVLKDGLAQCLIIYDKSENTEVDIGVTDTTPGNEIYVTRKDAKTYTVSYCSGWYDDSDDEHTADAIVISKAITSYLRERTGDKTAVAIYEADSATAGKVTITSDGITTKATVEIISKDWKGETNHGGSGTHPDHNPS